MASKVLCATSKQNSIIPARTISASLGDARYQMWVKPTANVTMATWVTSVTRSRSVEGSRSAITTKYNGGTPFAKPHVWSPGWSVGAPATIRAAARGYG